MEIEKLNEELKKVLNEFVEDSVRDMILEDLEYLYKGIGWSDWDYYREHIQDNPKLSNISDKELESIINSSNIAKVKLVQDLQNYEDMEDFDINDFYPTSRIIVTRKPMSSKFYGESLQKNEAREDLVKIAKKLTNYGLIYSPVRPLAMDIYKFAKTQGIDCTTDEAFDAAKTIFRESV